MGGGQTAEWPGAQAETGLDESCTEHAPPPPRPPHGQRPLRGLIRPSGGSRDDEALTWGPTRRGVARSLPPARAHGAPWSPLVLPKPSKAGPAPCTPRAPGEQAPRSQGSTWATTFLLSQARDRVTRHPGGGSTQAAEPPRRAQRPSCGGCCGSTQRHPPSLRAKPAHGLPCSPCGWTSTQAGIAGRSHNAQPATVGWPVSPLRSAGGLQSSSVPPGSAFGMCGGSPPPPPPGEAEGAAGRLLIRTRQTLRAREGTGGARQAAGEQRQSREAPRPPSWEEQRRRAPQEGPSRGGSGNGPFPPTPPGPASRAVDSSPRGRGQKRGPVRAPIWKVSFPLSKTKDLKQTHPVESFLSKPASQRGILIQPSASSTSCPPGSRTQKSQRQRETRGSGNLGSRAKDTTRCFPDRYYQKPPRGVPLSCLSPKLRPCCTSCCLALAGP